MEQTAVNYLIQELFKVHDENFDFNPIFVKAIEMEREQIMNANVHGFSDGINHEKDMPVRFISSLDYYNETFKSE